MTLTLRHIDAFQGLVLDSDTFDDELVVVGSRVGCIGTDAEMLEVVVRMVDAGHRVKVFEDQPRRVVPSVGVGLPRSAEALAASAYVLRRAARAAQPLPGGGLLRQRARRTAAAIDTRAASALRARQVPDRWVRRQLTPTPLDRRPSLRSDRYLAAVGSDGCELVGWPIACISRDGVRTCDGIEHRLDVIVVAR
jgi:cation diffusion facilitator CzcD-associated flavoprotein CzcO